MYGGGGTSEKSRVRGPRGVIPRSKRDSREILQILRRPSRKEEEAEEKEEKKFCFGDRGSA